MRTRYDYLLGYGGEISVRLHLLYFLFMRTRYDYLLGYGGEISEPDMNGYIYCIFYS